MSVQDFKARVRDVARTNRFKVFGNFGSVSRDIEFLCHSSSLPSSKIGVTSLNYMGQAINYAAERSWEDWGCTAYFDSKGNLRKEAERWLDQMQLPNVMTGSTNVEEYRRELHVVLLDRQDAPIVEYKLVGCVLKGIGANTLAWGTDGKELNVDLTFSYDWHEVIGGGGLGGFIGSLFGG